MEPAAGWRADQAGWLAVVSLVVRLVKQVRVGSSRAQQPCVRVCGVPGHLLGRSLLDELAGVHDQDVVGEVPGAGDVVGDVKQPTRSTCCSACEQDPFYQQVVAGKYAYLPPEDQPPAAGRGVRTHFPALEPPEGAGDQRYLARMVATCCVADAAGEGGTQRRPTGWTW
jgi:hypothetical protein